MTTFVEKAKANPMMTGIVMFITIASGGSAAWNGAEWIDSVHTTELELIEYVDTSHPVSTVAFAGLTERLDAAQVVNKCRWLKSEIRGLKDSLYQRRRDNGDPDYINDLEQDLDEMEDEYDALGCTLLLS